MTGPTSSAAAAGPGVSPSPAAPRDLLALMDNGFHGRPRDAYVPGAAAADHRSDWARPRAEMSAASASGGLSAALLVPGRRPPASAVAPGPRVEGVAGEHAERLADLATRLEGSAEEETDDQDLLARLLDVLKDPPGDEALAAVVTAAPFAIRRLSLLLEDPSAPSAGAPAARQARRLLHLAWNQLMKSLTRHPTFVDEQIDLRAVRDDLVAAARKAPWRPPALRELPAVLAHPPPSGRQTHGPKEVIALESMPEPVRNFINRIRQEQGVHRAQRLLLLHGLPGSGKTTIAENVAVLLDASLFVVECEFRKIFFGASANGVYTYFAAVNAYARARNKRAVVLIDEIESLLPARCKTETDQERNTVVSAFLQVAQQHSEKMSHVVIVAATNHPEFIDKGALSRFGGSVLIAPPSPDQVRAILADKLVPTSPLTGSQLDHLRDLCDGADYREMERWMNEAPQGASYSQIRTFLARARIAATSDVEVFTSTGGFTAKINASDFNERCRWRSTPFVFSAEGRLWAFTFRHAKPSHHAGPYLEALDGDVATQTTVCIRMYDAQGRNLRQDQAMRPASSRAADKAWFVSWEEFFGQVDLKPGSIMFHDCFPEDSLQVRIEVATRRAARPPAAPQKHLYGVSQVELRGAPDHERLSAPVSIDGRGFWIHRTGDRRWLTWQASRGEELSEAAVIFGDAPREVWWGAFGSAHGERDLHRVDFVPHYIRLHLGAYPAPVVCGAAQARIYVGKLRNVT